MKIAIDCRYLGKSGLGRVNDGFLNSLKPYLGHHEFLLLGDPELLKGYEWCGKILDFKANPFSKSGLFLPKNIKKAVNDCDAFYSPGYIFPLGLRIPKFMTICDCVFFDVPSTTNGFVDTKIKKFFYRRAVKKSKKVFTISEFSKGRIESLFHPRRGKLINTYIGLSKSVLDFIPPEKPARSHFLFVGNFKAHKGIDTLVAAYRKYREKGGTIPLVLVGKEEGFRNEWHVPESEKMPGIEFTGRISDERLLDLMANALALVQPSRYEGFGLPPLEAMSMGTGAILNDIPVFRELFSNSGAVFYKYDDVNDLCAKMLSFKTPEIDRTQLLAPYSYEEMTKIIMKEIASSH